MGHYFYLTHVYDDNFPSLLSHMYTCIYCTVDQNYYVESWYIGRKIKASAATTTTLSSSSLSSSLSSSSSSSSSSSYHMKKLNMEPFCESCRKFTGPLGPPNLEFLGLKLQIPRLKWDNPQDRTMEGHIINNPKGMMMIIMIVDDNCMNRPVHTIYYSVIYHPHRYHHHHHHHTSSSSSSASSSYIVIIISSMSKQSNTNTNGYFFCFENNEITFQIQSNYSRYDEVYHID